MEYPCGPCVEKNKLIEANIRCNSCQVFFCTGCSYSHSRKHPDHRVTLREEDGISSIVQRIVKCNLHGDVISMFCPKHDEVVCASCIVSQLKHGSCDSLKHIPTEIDQLLTHTDLTKTVESLNQHYEDLSISLEIILKHKQHLEMDHVTARKAIEKKFSQYFGKMLNLKFVALREVDSKRKQIAEDIETKHENTESFWQNLPLAVLLLQTESVTNAAQKFVAMKQLQTKAKEIEKLIREIRDSSGSHGIAYAPDPKLEKCLEEMTSLGMAQTKDQLVYQEVSTMSQFIGEPGDSPSNITSCCVLDDGSVVLVDEANKKLKLLENLILKHSHVLQNTPCSVCAISSNEIVVSLSNRSVNVFGIEKGSFSFKTTFNLPHNCKSVAFNHGELYIADGISDIHVYNSQMNFVQSLSSLTGFNFIPSKVLFNAEGTILTVEESWRLIGVDRHGKEVFSVYQQPKVLCSAGSQGFFQAEASSWSIIQLGPKAVKIGEVMQLSVNQPMPQAMCFNPQTKQLILVSKPNEIQVYNLDYTFPKQADNIHGLDQRFSMTKI